MHCVMLSPLPCTRMHTHSSNTHFSPGCVQWLWEWCGALGDMASLSPRLLGHPHSITPALGWTAGTLAGPQETKDTISGGPQISLAVSVRGVAVF